MRASARRLVPPLAACALLLVLARAFGPWEGLQHARELGPGRTVAPGVVLYQLTRVTYSEPPAPLSIWILRVDLSKADLRPALAHDRVMDTETVAAIAARHGAVAAINGGFFLPNGHPLGLLKIDGQIVSDTRRPRGAVGIVRTGDRPRLIFDRVSAALSLHVQRSDEAPAAVEIAGVDTTRLLGRLMLFTPAYHAHTDTAPGGLEWAIRGDPLRVETAPRSEGKTRIPPDGFVLSFGGRSPPAELAALQPGAEVAIEARYMPAHTDPDDWAAADDIIGGAGLLARDGVYVTDWTAESFAAGFAEGRHPRTMIGATADGTAWLVVVDGRQPELSAGMTLVELRELARDLGFTGAVNLDGGGSTTMWVDDGGIVSSPSDAAGPRPVSDALLVMSR